jgi:predicted PurR-regulated permease PerM
MPGTNAPKSPMAQAIDIAINLAIVVVFVALCYQILQPFISLIIWGGIISIAIYPVYTRLRGRLGGRQKTTLVAIVLLGFAAVIVPVWFFTGSLVEAGVDLRAQLEEGMIEVPPPGDRVQSWPVVGERLYEVWSEASSDLSAFLGEHETQIRNMTRSAINAIASAGLEALQFLVSVMIAAVFLAYAESLTAVSRRLLQRFSGSDAESLRALVVATTRSITVGVLGIALIQAIAAGLGLALVGVPAAGLWALLVLVLAVLQLPPLIVMLPIALYVFSVQSTLVGVLFFVWAVLVSISDTFLKPMLLGRGVEAPMIVILLGAIGGLMMSGFIGLFLGAVVLGVSYRLLLKWLELGEAAASDDAEHVTAGDR